VPCASACSAFSAHAERRDASEPAGSRIEWQQRERQHADDGGRRKAATRQCRSSVPNTANMKSGHYEQQIAEYAVGTGYDRSNSAPDQDQTADDGDRSRHARGRNPLAEKHRGEQQPAERWRWEAG